MQIIRNRRRKLGLTQNSLAMRVGVTQAAVSQWEKGISLPNITLLPKLAAALDCSVDDLVERKEEN